ncbi:MAG: secretin N-terminal domain-containing protein [Candidatus Omnitrophica bacterium]|nr:secretin N-terminal domain-containing protein [Candidatus Omnitrophota bacterium]
MIKTKRFSGLYSIWGWAVFLSAGLFFCAVCPAFELSDEETGQADEAALAQEQPGGFEQVLNTGEDKRLSLDYKDADLNSVLKSLAYTYNLNLVSTKDIKGSITLTLNNVTVNEALEAILTVSGYAYHRKGNLIYIYPAAGTEDVGLITTSLMLKYLTADDASALLTKSLSPRGDIRVNDVNNSIVIRDYPPVLDKIKALLEEIDAAPLQVLIEAKIVDIDSKDLQNIGATYTATYTAPTGLFNSNGSAYRGPDEVGGTLDLSGPSSTLDGGQFKLNSFVLKNWNVTAQIDALVQDQKANILASPSIATINGKEARIVIGEKVPYKEKTQTTTGTTETTKFIDVGTTLRVTPQISSDGYITMVVHPEVSSVKSLTLDAGPYISTREADTVVRVKDGETLVIGGLIKNENKHTRSRVPVLGYIPMVGLLFGNKSVDLNQTELAVFITPHIISTASEKKKIRSIDREEVYVNVVGTGERALVNYLFEQARNLEANEGIESRRKDAKTRMANALDLYRQIASQFPGNEKTPESLFRAGTIYYSYFRDLAGAKECFNQLLEDYPESRYAPRSKYLLRAIQKKEERAQKAAQSLSAGKADVRDKAAATPAQAPAQEKPKSSSAQPMK